MKSVRRVQGRCGYTNVLHDLLLWKGKGSLIAITVRYIIPESDLLWINAIPGQQAQQLFFSQINPASISRQKLRILGDHQRSQIAAMVMKGRV